VVSETYYKGREARFDGSGGSSGNVDVGFYSKITSTLKESDLKNKANGGSGGGVIWMTVTNTTQIVNSTISANGDIGSIHSKEMRGSGGGSGGSI